MLCTTGLLLTTAACGDQTNISPPPTDQPHLPTASAVHPQGKWLAATSSNFDLSFRSGALLLADLDKVNTALDSLGNADSPDASITDAYTAAALVPSFAGKPVFRQDGRQIFLAARGDNRLLQLHVDGIDPANPDAADAQNIRLRCMGTAADDPNNVTKGTVANAVTCLDADQSVQLPESDPEQILLIEDNTANDQTASVHGLVTLQSSTNIYPFAATETNLQLATPLSWGEGVTGLQGLQVYTSPSQQKYLLALLQRTASTTLRSGVELRTAPIEQIDFTPTSTGSIDPVALDTQTTDLTGATGSISSRDLVLAENGTTLLVLLRDPDALARFTLEEVVDGNNTAIIARLSGIVGTCLDPSGLSLIRAGGVERAVISCFGDDTISAFDTTTLTETDTVRFFGNAPVDIEVFSEDGGDRVYVSFFLDDTIGVLRFAGDEDPQLTPLGRIGVALPAPEDGRP